MKWIQNMNRRVVKWFLLAVCSIGCSLPFFIIASSAHAAFDYTYDRTPAETTVTNDIYGTITVTDDSDCSFAYPLTKAALIVTRFGGGADQGAYIPYTVNEPFIVSVGGLPLSATLDDPDGQYTSVQLRLSNEAEDSTCTKGLESSSYPERLFTLIDGTTTPPELPGGGGTTTTTSTVVLTPEVLDALQVAALGIAFLVFIVFGYIGYKSSERNV